MAKRTENNSFGVKTYRHRLSEGALRVSFRPAAAARRICETVALLLFRHSLPFPPHRYSLESLCSGSFVSNLSLLEFPEYLLAYLRSE